MMSEGLSPADLVSATRKLTPAEEEEMKKHAWAGYEYLRKEYSFWRPGQ